MDPKVRLVLNGFFELTDTQRAAAAAEMNKFINGTAQVRDLLHKSLSESSDPNFGRKSQAAVNFGPAPGGCPCCGR